MDEADKIDIAAAISSTKCYRMEERLAGPKYSPHSSHNAFPVGITV